MSESGKERRVAPGRPRRSDAGTGLSPREAAASRSTPSHLEERLVAALERLGDGVLLTDAHGVVEYASSRFCEVSGYTARELVGQRAYRFLLTTAGQRAVRRRLGLPVGAPAPCLELELRHKNGDRLHVEVLTANLGEAGGKPAGALALFHEVSRQLRAEQAGRASEQGLRLMLDRVPSILWTTDRELRFTSGGGRGLVDLEVRPEELIGMSLSEYFGTDDPDFPALAEHRRALAGHSTSYEHVVAGLAYEVHLEPLRGQQREIVGVVGLARDVTAQRSASAALAESERGLADLVEHSRDLFYRHGPDHQLTYVSPQSRQFFDCEPEEALRRWTEFLTEHPANQLGYESTRRAILTGERQPPYELELQGARGRRIWVEVREAPIVRGGEVVGIVGALTDITERKRLEERQRTATEVSPRRVEATRAGAVGPKAPRS